MSAATDMKNNDFEIKGVRLSLVEASKLSLDDEFMQYNPRTVKDEKFKNLLTKVIQKGVKDFYLPFKGQALFCETICKPTTNQSYEWWETKARTVGAIFNSRLGTKSEYIAFIGTLMKELMNNGWSKEKVWNAICIDSKELGANVASHYPSQHTGSRKCCGYYDLNIPKVLACDDNEMHSGFWIAGTMGEYHSSITTNSITDFIYYSYHKEEKILFGSIGWVIITEIHPYCEEI